LEQNSSEFDWDQENAGHLSRHRVSPDEAEQVVTDPHAVLVELQFEGDEERIKAIGMTRSGRLLAAVFTLRGPAIRVITAYRAPARLRHVYLERRALR